MPAFVDTGLNVVHVDDVAEGHLLALQRGRIGERYILGGDNVTLRDVLIEIAELTGGRPPLVRLSPGLVLPLAVVAQAWALLAGGGEPLLTVNGVRLARKRMFFSCEKAKRELGYRWRPATEGLRDAVAWYREHKMLPALRSSSRLGGVGAR
jgi:dihydroflavonol-4-reductase